MMTLMRTSLHYTLSSIALMMALANAQAVTVYQSIGKYGEPRYSQLPPQGSHTALNFYQPKSAAPPIDATRQKQCQILRDNLATLNAGGDVHEVSDDGSQKALTADEVRHRIHQTQDALNLHCQNS